MTLVPLSQDGEFDLLFKPILEGFLLAPQNLYLEMESLVLFLQMIRASCAPFQIFDHVDQALVLTVKLGTFVLESLESSLQIEHLLDTLCDQFFEVRSLDAFSSPASR